MGDDNFKKIAEDATTFPILTEEVSFPANSSRSGMTAGTAPLSQKVDLTLREILGWRPRNNDPRGFLASLGQAFEIKQFEGHTEWMWRPRTYAAEADLGAITGAQASIYSRARAALDQSLPLLDGLEPLRSDFDMEDIDAVRSIVRSGLTELVYELGIEGGPRLARVNGYFRDLLGAEFTQLPGGNQQNPKILDNPEDVGGQLGSVRDVFGLLGAQVNTVDEEQNLTNFLILVDLVNSLWLTWRSQQKAFDHSAGGRSFLGTQLVLLSRNLSVVAESVDELYFAMNSVFLGPAERQVTKLEFTGTDFQGNPIKGQTVFVGELLDWVQRFAAEEGPRLLREGGKEGVIQAFQPTIARLINLVDGAAIISRRNSGNPTRGFHTARVQRAVEELKNNLVATRDNAGLILRSPGPDINLLTQIPNGNHPILIVNGRNFRQGGTVRLVIFETSDETKEKFGFDLPPEGITFINPTEIKTPLDVNQIFTIFSGYVNGGSLITSVVTTNPDGQISKGKTLVLNNHSQIPTPQPTPQPTSPPPIIKNVTHIPVSIKEGKGLDNLHVTISGSGFLKGAIVGVKFNDQSVSSKPNISVESTKIEATFDLSYIIRSLHPPVEGIVVVTNPDGQKIESSRGQRIKTTS